MRHWPEGFGPARRRTLVAHAIDEGTSGSRHGSRAVRYPLGEAPSIITSFTSITIGALCCVSAPKGRPTTRFPRPCPRPRTGRGRVRPMSIARVLSMPLRERGEGCRGRRAMGGIAACRSAKPAGRRHLSTWPMPCLTLEASEIRPGQTMSFQERRADTLIEGPRRNRSG